MPELFARTRLRLSVPPETVGKPRFWVERLCVWGGDNEIVRDVPLRPGLNIIWSPDAKTDDDAIGHGAGKTTFCRLMRFCLGENSFGSGERQDRIREAFPGGKVGIEVHVDGVRWSIIRYFNRYHRDVVTPMKSLEQALSGERPTETMADFMTAVQSAFFAGVHELLPKKIHKDSVWETALAWLSRDQECRFDGALDWRHAQTESNSTVRNLTVMEHSQVARAMLSCLSAEEASLEESTTARNNDSEIEAERLAWAIERQQRLLSDKLDLNVDLGIGDLDAALLEQEIHKRFPEAPADRVSALRFARQSLLGKYKRALQNIRDAQDDQSSQVNKLAGDSGLLTLAKGKLDLCSTTLTYSQSPACPVCSVSLDRIFEEGCPCSSALVDLSKAREEVQRSMEDFESAKLVEATSRGRLADLAAIAERARRLAEDTFRELEEAEAAENAAASTSDEGRILLQAVEELRGLIRDHQKARLRVEDEKKAAKERSDRLSNLRAVSRTSLQALSRRFDHIIRELVPGEVSGRVELTGATLVLTVGPGERSTAAIDSLKAVAFDLSALTLACENEAKLPPWLLHDSPREADLGESIYERLFTFASQLESLAGFQYIITTTTPPPMHMQQDPHLCLTIKSDPARERLLRYTLS